MSEENNHNVEEGNTKESDEYYFKLWKSYEDVAMHFNDLIIRLRIQSIGGIAALAAILGIFLKDSSGNSFSFNYCIATVALFVLTMFWLSIFFLDIFYYNRLLEGAVNAILKLEQNKDEFLVNKDINLSTNIELAFRTRFKHEPKGLKKIFNGRIGFYLVVLLALIITFTISCTMMIKCNNYETNKPITNVQVENDIPESVDIENKIIEVNNTKTLRFYLRKLAKNRDNHLLIDSLKVAFSEMFTFNF